MPKQRRLNQIPLRPRILIVCEGETEEVYFRCFRVTPHIRSKGRSTESLVNYTLHYREENGFTKRDEVWCVFDKDQYGKQQFNNAIRVAENAGLSVAYSNISFELWLALHYHDVITPHDQVQYEEMLKRVLGEPYKKADEPQINRIFSSPDYSRRA
ncbi:MAG: RloB family protein [Armatimonadota bacterium]